MDAVRLKINVYIKVYSRYKSNVYQPDGHQDRENCQYGWGNRTF